MKYFRATKKILNDRDVVKFARPTNFYVNASIEMDKQKSTNIIARMGALYIAGSAEFAVYFLLEQGTSLNEIKLYEVTAKIVHEAPFALTHQVDKRLNNGSCASCLIKEYWTPSLKWSFYEYLTDEFIVVKELKVPTIDWTIAALYSTDVNKAEGIHC